MAVYFRRIKGRIIPIKVGSQDFSLPDATVNKMRRVTAETARGRNLGTLDLFIPKGKNYARVGVVQVAPRFKQQGIAKTLFKHTAELLQRTGRSFLRATAIEHVAQVKIRSGFKTKFIASQGGVSKLLNAKQVLNILNSVNKEHVLIRASTLIRKKKLGF